MSRQERYGTRDLAFSRWHRAIPRDDLVWIDIDHWAYCDRCKEPIYIFELARDVGQDHKATTVTRRAAQRLGIPALLVFYRVDEVSEEILDFRVKRIAPTSTRLTRVKPRTLVDWIIKTRREHVCLAADEPASGSQSANGDVAEVTELRPDKGVPEPVTEPTLEDVVLAASRRTGRDEITLAEFEMARAEVDLT